ncbi:MAG: hypothetical protein LBU34_16305, partial [Planctomycetaceae bacterium]|nr:hypothetical protein [Planctomycetaceae bacterium]
NAPRVLANAPRVLANAPRVLANVPRVLANAPKVCQQKVGNPSPKGCLPIGNRNNQHEINSLSANADAIVRRTIAYLVINNSRGRQSLGENPSPKGFHL